MNIIHPKAIIKTVCTRTRFYKVHILYI